MSGTYNQNQKKGIKIDQGGNRKRKAADEAPREEQPPQQRLKQNGTPSKGAYWPNKEKRQPVDVADVGQLSHQFKRSSIADAVDNDAW